jgi:hypothetical protein
LKRLRLRHLQQDYQRRLSQFLVRLRRHRPHPKMDNLTHLFYCRHENLDLLCLCRRLRLMRHRRHLTRLTLRLNHPFLRHRHQSK